jgi:hypothetical protein
MPKPTERPDQRSTITVSSKLENKLAAYFAAACAAGVGVLALAPSAEGKIIYTPADIVIGDPTPLDLNHDGVNDFMFYVTAWGDWEHFLASGAVASNRILGYVSVLRVGVPVGPKGQFLRSGMMATFGVGISQTYVRGKWANVQNRYLGLQFSINGQTHYGWARLTVTVKHGILATLTGYAYETIPNKRIITGKTSGTDSVETGDNTERVAAWPANLGMLACGSDALALWRRDPEMLTD